MNLNNSRTEYDNGWAIEVDIGKRWRGDWMNLTEGLKIYHAFRLGQDWLLGYTEKRISGYGVSHTQGFNILGAEFWLRGNRPCIEIESSGPFWRVTDAEWKRLKARCLGYAESTLEGLKDEDLENVKERALLEEER